MKKRLIVFFVILSVISTFLPQIEAKEIPNIALGNTSQNPAMFDGDITTGWRFNCGDVVIDLGENYYISDTEITADSVSSVSVSRYSTDNVNWVYEAPKNGTMARYLVLTDYGHYYGSIFSTVYEVRIFGEKIKKINIAKGKCKDDVWAAAFDGNESTGWTFTCGDIVVDLGTVYSISEIKISADSVSSVDVTRYSLDKASWIYSAPSGGIKARYLVLSDYGYYHQGIYSTLKEVCVYVESDEKPEYTRNITQTVRLKDAIGPNGAAALTDGDESTTYTGIGAEFDLRKEYTVESVYAKGGSIDGVGYSPNGIDYFNFTSGVRCRYISVGGIKDVTEIVIKVSCLDVDSDYVVSDFGFTDGENIVISNEIRDSYGAFADISNTLSYDKDFRIFCVVYSGNGKILSIASDKETVPGYLSKRISTSNIIDKSLLDENSYKRMFLWTDGEMIPLVNVQTLD